MGESGNVENCDDISNGRIRMKSIDSKSLNSMKNKEKQRKVENQIVFANFSSFLSELLKL